MLFHNEDSAYSGSLLLLMLLLQLRTTANAHLLVFLTFFIFHPTVPNSFFVCLLVWFGLSMLKTKDCNNLSIKNKQSSPHTYTSFFLSWTHIFTHLDIVANVNDEKKNDPHWHGHCGQVSTTSTSELFCLQRLERGHYF